MAVIPVLALCAAVVISAVAAERSARAGRRCRAVCLNLCGLGCLGVGLMTLYAWCHSGTLVMRQVAMAQQTRADADRLMRLYVEGDAAGADEGAGADESADESADAEPALQNLPEQPAESSAESSAESPAPSAAPAAAGGSETPAEADELPAEVEDQEPGGPPEADDGLPGPLASGVQIDFAARPEWVDCEPRDAGAVHQVSVCSGPYRTQPQARRELSGRLKVATDEYINELLGRSAAACWIAFDESRILQTLVSPGNIYDEKVVSPSVGVMYQSHALLEFGPEFRRDIEESWRQIVARARLVNFALAAAAVLGSLALLLSYFQADTATRGFYTGRLKFATLVAILGLVVSGMLLARSIPWLWL